MANKDVVKAERILRRLLEVRGIGINKIIVFGSYIKNTMTADSDMDFIVVSKDLRNKDIFERVEFTSGIHRDLVRRIRKPVDIVYYSDKEWEKGNSILIREVKENGVIYG